jgi:hypothetical protein
MMSVGWVTDRTDGLTDTDGREGLEVRENRMRCGTFAATLRNWKKKLKKNWGEGEEKTREKKSPAIFSGGCTG